MEDFKGNHSQEYCHVTPFLNASDIETYPPGNCHGRPDLDQGFQDSHLFPARFGSPGGASFWRFLAKKKSPKFFKRDFTN